PVTRRAARVRGRRSRRWPRLRQAALRAALRPARGWPGRGRTARAARPRLWPPRVLRCRTRRRWSRHPWRLLTLVLGAERQLLAEEHGAGSVGVDAVARRRGVARPRVELQRLGLSIT